MKKSSHNNIELLMFTCIGALLSVPFCTVQASESEIEKIEVLGRNMNHKLELERALNPGGVTLIDGDVLKERNISNLADALRYVPGVWATSSSGGDGLFFSSRGSNLDATSYDMNGIKLLQDGLSVTTADGNNHNRIIDPLAVRFASVAKGANALTYGASTLGGAINFVSPTALNSKPFSLYLNTGSHGLNQARVTAGAKFDNDLDAQVTVESKRRDGYRDHSEQERTGLYANVGWKLSDNLDTRFFYTYLDNDQELPGSLTQAELDEDPNQAAETAIGGNFQINVETHRLANKTNITIDKNSSLEFGLSLEKQTLYHPVVDKVLVDFDGPGPNPPVEVFSLLIDTDHQDIGAMARYNLKSGDHNLLFGFNWAENEVTGGNFRNDGGQRNGLTTIVENTAESLEVFAVDRWSLSEQLTLVYGLQAVNTDRDVRNTDVTSNELRNPSASYSSFNPRAGLIFDISSDVSFFGNVSQLFEAPTNFELEDDVRASSETLDAMEGVMVEIGTRGGHQFANNSYVTWDISAYYASIQDEILSRDDPAAPGNSLVTNIDDTVHAGIEALINGGVELNKVKGRLETTLSISINKFSFDDDPIYGNNDLPAAPGYVVHGELLYKTDSGFYLGPTFDIVDERYVDFANTTEVDSYSLLGFRAGYNTDDWQVFTEFKNLTDKAYVSNLSVLNIAEIDSRIFNSGEPRSVYVGFQIGF